MPSIHPTASISPRCELAPDAEIGPGCVLTGRVVLGPGVRLIGNVYLSGPVEVGAGTQIYPFACIGFPGQDAKFKLGDPTAGVTIGRSVLIREHATVHAATNDRTPTRVGDRAFLMVGSHLGHDSSVGDGVILVNGAALAGHSRVDDGAIMSGGAMLHQHCRIGRLAMTTGLIGITMNIPPFCLMSERNRLEGVNQVGLRRAGMSRDEITRVRRAFREAFRRNLPKADMLAILEERAKESPAVGEMAAFVAQSTRPIAPGKGRPPRSLTTWLQLRRRGQLPVEPGGAESDDEV